MREAFHKKMTALTQMAFEPHGLFVTWMGKVQGPSITAMAVSDGGKTGPFYMVQFNKGIISVFRRDHEDMSDFTINGETMEEMPTWTAIFSGKLTTHDVLCSAAGRIRRDICEQYKKSP